MRASAGKIDLIVSYSPWFGWFRRPVAVPIEFVGMFGRNIASLDMLRQDYANAPTWHATDAQADHRNRGHGPTVLNDRAEGLDVGADDYVDKPFDLDKVAARLRALVRRAVSHSVPIRVSIFPILRE